MALHYYPLINKLLSSLRIKDGLRPLAVLQHQELFQKPFITISREPGSGGKPIAQALAAKLGFEFVDKEIVEYIAQSTKRRQSIIQAIDERARSKIEDTVHSLLNQEYVDDVRYLRELVTIILAYAYRGHVVILGRGGNFITPFAKGLHVRITAPYELRVKRAMDFEGLKREEARELIAEITNERRKFIKQYFNEDVTKPSSYDLIVNTSYFTIDEAKDVIAEAFYQKFSRFDRYAAILR